jgi:hypothetical protein
MFICGNSLGGWTSMLATFGDQDVFKASLSFDPAYMFHWDKVMNKEFNCKWPVFSLMSSQFIPVNCAKLWGFGDQS